MIVCMTLDSGAGGLPPPAPSGWRLVCLARPEPSRDTRFQTDTHNYQGECQISRVSYYTMLYGKIQIQGLQRKKVCLLARF